MTELVAVRFLEETSAHAIGDAVKVQKRKEINGLKFAIDGRWTAQTGGDIEVSSKKARRLGRTDGCAS